MEAFAACFYICGHPEWAEEVLKHFRYGQPFLEINAQLLKRYAACSDEEDVKKTEQHWLEKIEREYSEKRAEGGTGSVDDMWESGNTNHQGLLDSEDENEDNESDGEDGEDEGIPNQLGVPLEIPAEDTDDEEEMAELRRKVLASKPFRTSTEEERPVPETVVRNEPPADSDAESGSDESKHDDFDNIINATPVTDRTGILAHQRLRGLDQASASFSRTVVSAPKKW